MILTENIRSLVRQSTFVISAHAILLIVYSLAHEKLDLMYTMSAYTPILLLFALGPLVAVFFFSTQSARQAAVAMLGILPAELLYNIVTRFSGRHSVFKEGPILIWKIIYEGSFGLILILEVIGFFLTLKILLEIHKQIDVPHEPSSE